MTKDEYTRYLKSPEWQERRALAIKRANGKCQDCLDERRYCRGIGYMVRRAQEVHHLTYDRVGRERPDDLVALCNRHHRERHGAETSFQRDCRLSMAAFEKLHPAQDWVPDLSQAEPTILELLGVTAKEVPWPPAKGDL